LKISAAIASLLANVRAINALMSKNKINGSDAGRTLDGLREMDTILQVCDFGKKMKYSDDAADLIRQREDARQKKDWATADLLREKLVAMGVSVHDKKVGVI
jgi:cysteinyl-tRNA synthetase